MKRPLRQTLLGALAVGVMTISSTPLAIASDTQDLEDRIAALEAMIAELRAEVAQSRADDRDQIVRVAQVEQHVETLERTMPSSETPGFMAGNTRIGFGGYVDLDVHVTDLSDGEFGSTSIARDFYIPGATPVGGSGDGEPDTDFTAEATRFFFTSKTPTESGDITGRIEFDFLGSASGNERVSNSYNPRLRTAWLQYNGWRVGQDWSTFQNTSAIPESASFLVANDGMIFDRQAQVRYTSGNWQFALENPNTTVTPFGGGGRIVADDGAIPDVVVRYNARGDFGNLAFAALGRNLSYEGGGVDGSAFGWGLSVQGRLNVSENSDLRVSLSGGEGMGRYIGLNAANGAVATASGDLEAIPSVGGLIAYRHVVGEGRRFNIGYSALHVDNDTSLTGTGVTSQTQSGFENYLWNIAPKVTVGAELLFGERELENGQSGSITRATMSTKYSF